MTSRTEEQAPRYEGATAALEFAIWSLDDQIRTMERTDGKSERAITLGVAIIALFSGALTFQLADADRSATIVALCSMPLVAGCFIAAVWLFFRSYAAVNWYLGPDGARLLAVSDEHGDSRTRQWLAEEIFAAIERNAEDLKRKTDQSTWVFRAVLLEAASAGIGVVAIAIAAAA